MPTSLLGNQLLHATQDSDSDVARAGCFPHSSSSYYANYAIILVGRINRSNLGDYELKQLIESFQWDWALNRLCFAIRYVKCNSSGAFKFVVEIKLQHCISIGTNLYYLSVINNLTST